MSELRELLRDAHQRAARDNANLSSQLVIAMAQAGAPFEKTCASALLSLGTLHAPVTEARRLLRRPGAIGEILWEFQRAPGFGNSFYRDEVDPAFKELHDVIMMEHMYWASALSLVSHELERVHCYLYPNAAAYTAVVCEIEGVAEGTELALVIEARLPVWAELWAENRPRKELWRG